MNPVTSEPPTGYWTETIAKTTSPTSMSQPCRRRGAVAHDRRRRRGRQGHRRVARRDERHDAPPEGQQRPGRRHAQVRYREWLGRGCRNRPGIDFGSASDDTNGVGFGVTSGWCPSAGALRPNGRPGLGSGHRADRLRLVEAAEHKRAIGTKNPCGLFVLLECCGL
jgi:hypothetical protein